MKTGVPALLVAAVMGIVLGFFGASFSASSKPAATPTPHATAATAQPGVAEIDKARAAAAAGQTIAAADALAVALRTVEDAGPLRIMNLTMVEDSVRGYGLYTPVANATMAPNRPLLLYFEPGGMLHQPLEGQGGQWKIDLVADLAILDPQGTILDSKTDFLVNSVTSRRPNREMQFTLRLNMGMIPEGDYVAAVTLRDRLGNKKAVEKIAFKVRVP